MPTTDILIVSCAKHFPWLRYALKSIERFAHGFRQCKVLIPENDSDKLQHLLGDFSNSFGIPIRIAMFKDWPSKGFLRHEDIIIHSNEWTDADFILHSDSDCLFVEEFRPQDYFVEGKPVLMHGSYKWLREVVQANLDMWRETVERAIGGPVEQETMRRHPAVFSRFLYPKTQECIRAHTKSDAHDFIHSCREEFPQGFCEFNTLGAIAWRHFHDDYHWINHQELHENGIPWPNSKLVQFWSHGNPEEPQEPVYKGKPHRCTPAELLKSIP